MMTRWILVWAFIAGSLPISWAADGALANVANAELLSVGTVAAVLGLSFYGWCCASRPTGMGVLGTGTERLSVIQRIMLSIAGGSVAFAAAKYGPVPVPDWLTYVSAFGGGWGGETYLKRYFAAAMPPEPKP